jgi:hypothetical protein
VFVVDSILCGNTTKELGLSHKVAAIDHTHINRQDWKTTTFLKGQPEFKQDPIITTPECTNYNND